MKEARLRRICNYSEAHDDFWRLMDVDLSGKYLGFEEGPGKGDKSWNKAGDKFTQRANAWSKLGAGLQFSTIAYNTFCTTVLSYIGQLEHPPVDVYGREKQALRRMAPGPGNWITPQDCWHLKESYGLSKSFDSLELVAWAAKIRVIMVEGERVRKLAARVKEAILSSEYLGRRIAWKDWYDRSHVLVLQKALDDFECRGMTIQAVQKQMVGHGRPWKKEELAQIKKVFQRRIKARLLQADGHKAVNRLRNKMARWKLDKSGRVEMLPGKVAPRVLFRLSTLQRTVAPRVAAACFGTIWNRWCTGRRFSREGPCVFGCTLPAHDSIEHYVYCAAVHRVARNALRLDIKKSEALEWFVLAHLGLSDEENLICIAILVYAVYNSTNTLRKIGKFDPQLANDTMEQNILEAVRGHPASETILNGSWVQDNQHKRRRVRACE